MKALRALVLKELHGLFCSPIAYVVGALFSIFNGYVFWLLVQFVSDPGGQLNTEVMALFFGGTFFFWLSLLFMVPIITMRLMSEEKKSGTMELLLTSPISDMQIILAKFVSVLAFYLFLWTPALMYLLFLVGHGGFDLGIVSSCLLGLVSMGMLLLSLGLLASSLTTNQIVSAVLTFTAMMVLFLLGFLGFNTENGFFNAIVELTWLIHIFENLGEGQVHSKHIVFLLSLCVWNIFVSVQLLGLRRWRMNVLHTVILSFVMLLAINYIGVRSNHSSDWSKEQYYTLSDKSHKILDKVEETVDLIVFFPPTHPLFAKIRHLIGKYQSANPYVSVTWLDVVKDPAKAQLLADQYKIDSPESLVMTYQGRSKVVRVTDLADYDFSGIYQGLPPKLKGFKGEQGLSSALLSVLQTEQMKVHVLTGHGERELDNASDKGLRELKMILEEDNLLVEPVSLMGLEDLPEDIKTLLVMGPVSTVLTQERVLLDQLLTRGGRVMVLLDPLYETGLRDWAQTYGITVGQDIVVDPARKLPFVSPANLFVMEYNDEHEITRSMTNMSTLFHLASSVDGADTDRTLMSSLTKTSEKAWGEVNIEASPFSYELGKDKQGPISVAAAVQFKDSDGRLIVVGDSDFVANANFNNAGNKDFFLNMINWLLHRDDLIAIPAKETRFVKLSMTASDLKILFILVVLGIPLLWVMMGIVIYVRRKR